MKLSIFNIHRPAPIPGDEHKTASNAPRAVSYIVAGDSNLGIHVNQFAAQLLKTLLISSSILGTLLYLSNLPGMLANSQWVSLAIYGLVCFCLITLASITLLGGRFTGTRYAWLAADYLILLFVAGVGMLLTDGWYGNGRVLLVVLPLLAAFLFGSGSLASFIRVVTLVGSIAAVAIVGLLIGYGRDPLIRPLPDTSNLINWIMMVGGFSLVGLVCALALNAYLRVLEKSLDNSESIAQGFDQEHLRLENQVQQRTNDLERRLSQIRSVAEIIQSFGIVSESDETGGSTIPPLLQRVCELVRQRFNLYYVGVFLVEPSASGPGNAVLAAGTGEAGQKLLAEGYRLPVGGDSLIGWVTANRQARLTSEDQRPLEQRPADQLPLPPDTPPSAPEAAETGITDTAITDSLLSDAQMSEAANTDVQAAEIQSGTGSGRGMETRRFQHPYLPETRSELALPIISQQTVTGAMTIQSESLDAFDQDDILVLQGITDALANAIENARLIAETQANLAEIQSLHQQYLRRAWDEFLFAQGSQEYIYEAKRATGGLDTGQLASTKTGELAGKPTGRMGKPRRTVELPIRLRGLAIGNLSMEVSTDRSFTPEELFFIDSVIDQAALALENARLLDETRQRVEQEKVAAGITSKVWGSTDIDTILRTALKELGTALDASEAVIELWPE
jgi:GAF domain-containing protein